MCTENYPIRPFFRLDVLIKEVKELGKNKGYTFEPTTGMEFSLEEHCVYFKSGKRYMMYFGSWAPFWEQTSHPLCFGIDDRWEEETKGLKAAFVNACTGGTKSFGDHWTMGWFTKEDLLADDPSEQIWKRIEPILKAIYRLTEPT